MRKTGPAFESLARPQPLAGRIDRVDREALTGWALNPFAPQTRVTLAIRANGEVIGRIVADQHRQDLEDAGKGDGHCSFAFTDLAALAPDSDYIIDIYNEADEAPLPGSPIVLPAIAAPKPDPEPAPPPPPPQEMPADLAGNLDSVSRRRITGWAQDPNHPNRRVGLAVSIDGRVVGRLLADRFREDLQAAGIGDGNHAFDFMLPRLSPFAMQEVRVRREVDGKDLPGSPFILEPSGKLDAKTEAGLAALLADIDTDEGERHALAFLAEQTGLLLARRAERDSGRLARQAQAEFRRRWAGGTHDMIDAPPMPEASKPRALFVDEYVPSAGRDAGSVAILSHMRAVAALGYEVSFVAARGMEDIPRLEALAKDETVTAFGAPFYYSVEDLLKRQAGTFDVVYLHRIVNARAYLALVQTYNPKARILYSVADLHHLRLARQGEVQQRPELVNHSRSVAFAEFAAAAQAHAVITHSPIEAILLGERVAPNKVHVVPWSVPLCPNTVPFAERSGLGIVRQFGHPPNPDGVYWLTRHVMPLVWAEVPDFRCLIAGYGWTAGSLPNPDPRIEIAGPVDDLMEVFSRVRLTAAPLRFGAGIKGKVLESFAAGIPCAMTAIAAEGIALPSILRALVAESAEDMARIILTLHRDEAANLKAAKAGLALIAAEASEQRVLDKMAAILPKAG
jgi:glycosyltransferase involved in cell wall biosynthesis